MEFIYDSLMKRKCKFFRLEAIDIHKRIIYGKWNFPYDNYSWIYAMPKMALIVIFAMS